MPRYRYQALDKAGKRTVGEEDARDVPTLVVRLQARGLTAVQVEPAGAGKVGRLLPRRRGGLSAAERVLFTRELAHLVSSGVTLDRALAVVASSSDRPAVQELAQSVRQEVRGGRKLSEALSSRPELFDDLYRHMVRVGEMSGSLGQSLDRIAGHLEQREEMKRFLISSALYPTMLMAVSLFSVGLILGYVVPRFAEIFENLRYDLSGTTRFLVALSRIFRSYGWLVPVLAAAGCWIGLRLVRSPKWRTRLDAGLLSVPVLGPIVRAVETGRFAVTLSALLSGGVPILTALGVARDVSGNILVRRAVEHIGKNVRQGRRMSALMRDSKVFPAFAVHMVEVGEETGDLAGMLASVGREMDREARHRIGTVLRILEPATILVVGVLIGGIVVSMLSAVFSITDLPI
jgi:type II secretory pathway component PulF